MEAGYLGVGAMGQPMAHKLLDAGHGLTIYDINEAAMQPLLERQARRAASPKDLADRCEIVFVSLPTLAAFREVAFGADGLDPGQRDEAAGQHLHGRRAVRAARSSRRWRRAASRSSIARSPAARRARAPAPCRSWSPAIRRRSSASGR